MSEVSQPSPHQATRRRMVLGLTLAMAVLTAWAVWWFGGRSEDPRITEIRTLQRELAAKYPPGQAISGPVDAAARVAAIGQVMAKVQQLPPELRPQAYHGVFAPNHKLRPAVTAHEKREHRQAARGCDANPNPKPRSHDTSRIAPKRGAPGRVPPRGQAVSCRPTSPAAASRSSSYWQRSPSSAYW